MRTKQLIWLCLAIALCIVLATHSQAAYTECKVLDGSDFEGGTLIIQCEPEVTKDLKVGDTIKGKKIDKKGYEGC